MSTRGASHSPSRAAALVVALALTPVTAAADPPSTSPPPPAPDEPTLPPVVIAPTPPPGDDVVTLRDGGMLRGRIAERRADGTVVIVLLTGETRTVDGARIRSIDSLGAPTRPPRGAAPAPSPPPAVDLGPELTLRDSPSRAPLVIESAGEPLSIGPPMDAVLLPTMGSLGTPTVESVGQMLCTTPCTLYARSRTVRLWYGGDGRRSGTLTLVVPDRGVRLRLRSASAAGHTGGYWLTLLGVGGLVAGGGFLIFSQATARGVPPQVTFVATGVAALGVGALFLAIGIPLLVANEAGVESQSPLNGRDRVRARRHPSPRASVAMVPLAEGGALGVATATF